MDIIKVDEEEITGRNKGLRVKTGSLDFEEVAQLIQLVRDASLGLSYEERLSAISERLSELVPFSSFSAILLPPVSSACPRSFLRNVEPVKAEEYATHYFHFDPMAPICATSSGTPIILREVVRAAKWGADAYTGEFLARESIRDVMGFIAKTPVGDLAFALHRQRAHGDFNSHDKSILSLVAEDIARAAYCSLIREKIEEGTRRSSEGDDAKSGGMVLSEKGEVLMADAGAQRILERMDQRGEIDGLVEDGRKLLNSGAPAGTTIERILGRSDGGRGWVVARSTLVSGTRFPHVLCVLEVTRVGSSDRLELVVDRVGLTRRERQVAGLAVEGHGNQEIAYRLGISPVTVNVHLGKIYRKCNVQGRVELTRLVFDNQGDGG